MAAAKKQHTKVTTRKATGAGASYNLLILFAVPFLLYAQTIGFAFVYHDDDTIIINGSKVLESFNLHQLFFTDAWLMDKVIELYRPWQSFTYAIDYAIAGANPWVYHLHNLLVFCFGIQLLYLFLLKLKIPITHALWLSIIYSTHFLLAHTVSWVPARGDLYLTLFTLSALICCMNYFDTRKPAWLAATVLLYFMALLAKESAAVLPVLFVLLYFAYKKPGGALKLPALIVAAIPLGLALGVYLYMRSVSVAPQQSFISLSALAYNLPVLPEEVYKFFVPLGFSVMPAFNVVTTGAGFVFILLIGAAAFTLRSKINQKLFALGLAIFFVSLVVALFYKPIFIGFAYDYLDHRMFFPGIGLLLMVYALAQPFLDKVNLRYALPALALIMAVFAFINARNYKDKYAYYDNATHNTPKSGLAWINYGGELYADGRYNEAIDKFGHLVTLFPDSPSFKVRIAETYLAKKDTVGMLNQYRGIVKKHPTFIDAYYRMAGYYNYNNMTDSAINILTAAINADPANAQNYFERGRTYFVKAHLLPQAADDFKKSIALDSTKFGPYFELGSVYVSMADYYNAYLNFDKYVKLHPDGTGYFYRGQALCVLNRRDEGCQDLTTAAQMGVEQAGRMKEQFCK